MKTEIRKLRLTRDWRCGALVLRPGTYFVGSGKERGARVSNRVASRAVEEGAGYIEAAKPRQRKAKAPENKAIHAASSNKAALAVVHRSGDRPEPDA